MFNIFNYSTLQQTLTQYIPLNFFNYYVTLQATFDESLFTLETHEAMQVASYVLPTKIYYSPLFITLATLVFLVVFIVIQKLTQGWKFAKVFAEVEIILEAGIMMFILTIIPVFLLYMWIAVPLCVQNPNGPFAAVLTVVYYFDRKLFAKLNSDNRIYATVVPLAVFVSVFETKIILATICIKFFLIILGETRREYIATKLKNNIRQLLNNPFKGILIAIVPIMTGGEDVPTNTAAGTESAAVTQDTQTDIKKQHQQAANAVKKSPILSTAEEAASLIANAYTAKGGAHATAAQGTYAVFGIFSRVYTTMHWSKIETIKRCMRQTVVSNWQLPVSSPAVTGITPPQHIWVSVIENGLPSASEKFMQCPTCKLKMDWAETNVPTGTPNRFMRTITTSHCGVPHNTVPAPRIILEKPVQTKIEIKSVRPNQPNEN